MTTYVTIPNSDIDQDSPVTQPLMTALRDNPIAITEGAASAPRIVGKAATKFADMPVLTVSAADTQNIIYGVTSTLGTTATTSTSYVTARTITFDAVAKHTGTARFKASHRTTGSFGNTSSLRLLKNGSSVATWTTTSTSFVTRSVDVSFTSGDTFVWQHLTSSSSQTSYVSSSTYITANKAYIAIPLYIDSSEGI